MTAVTDGCTFELFSGLGHTYKELIIETASTVDTGNTIVIDLANYGCSYIKGIIGCVHTTENSVVVAEAPTTAVSSTTLTITVGGTLASDYKRVYRVLIA